MARPNKFVKVFIGRFQPFHRGHLKVLRAAIDTADRVIVVIGSAYPDPGSPKNPWTCYEREEMIRLSLKKKENAKVSVLHQGDLPDQDMVWVELVKTRVSEEARRHVKGKIQYTLIGCYKGAESYYLNLYKGWKQELVPQSKALNATDIRNALFALSADPDVNWADNLPPATAGYLAAWRRYNQSAFISIAVNSGFNV